MSFLNNMVINTNTQFFLFAGIGIIIFIMLVFMIMMKMDLSAMQRRYKRMMVGSEGEDIETMLTRNTNEIVRFAEDQKILSEDIQHIKNILEHAITRVSIIRFNAFEDTGSDLSYCVALLDDNNSGVIISAINGREESRSYAKPIINGKPSQYKLTQEEEKVLKDAMSKRY